MNRIALALLLLGACTGSSSRARAASEAVADDLCANLDKVVSVPLKPDWPTEDEHYSALRTNALAAKACLIDSIADTTPMIDPRSEPTKVDGFVVGDLAFFLLSDFGLVSFDEVLPDEVQEALPDRGVLAYFEWVQQVGNRLELQERCRQWKATAE